MHIKATFLNYGMAEANLVTTFTHTGYSCSYEVRIQNAPKGKPSFSLFDIFQTAERRHLSAGQLVLVPLSCESDVPVFGVLVGHKNSS